MAIVYGCIFYRARRTGEWQSTFCDVGLGGTVENAGRLNNKEIGENCTGLYKREFEFPTSWNIDKSHVFLVFEGVDSSLSVWLNGEFVGYSQDSCLTVEFEISKFLLVGTNLLCLQVTRWCDGSYLEDQDKWLS
jgi:beta-galactosidase/beta-glucuronidase